MSNVLNFGFLHSSQRSCQCIPFCGDLGGLQFHSCERSHPSHEMVASLFSQRFDPVCVAAGIPVVCQRTRHVVIFERPRLLCRWRSDPAIFWKFLDHSAMCCYVYYFCGNPIFDREQFDVRPEAQAYSLLVRIHPCLPCMSLTVIHQNRSLAESTERFAQLRAARRVHAMRELLVGIVNPVPSSDSPVG